MEYIHNQFGSMQPLADAVRDGRILGIVYMVGCNNPNGNEKGIDAALGFRLNGISSYHCVEAQIYGSKNVIEHPHPDLTKGLH